MTTPISNSMYAPIYRAPSYVSSSKCNHDPIDCSFLSFQEKAVQIFNTKEEDCSTLFPKDSTALSQLHNAKTIILNDLFRIRMMSKSILEFNQEASKLIGSIGEKLEPIYQEASQRYAEFHARESNLEKVVKQTLKLIEEIVNVPASPSKKAPPDLKTRASLASEFLGKIPEKVGNAILRSAEAEGRAELDDLERMKNAPKQSTISD